MYKNKNLKISDKYSDHLYTGIIGIMMKYLHNTLENFSDNKKTVLTPEGAFKLQSRNAYFRFLVHSCQNLWPKPD